MSSRFVLPLADVGDGITPSDGATLSFFATGTSTPKDTFSDEALTTPNANPVVADSTGVFPDIWSGSGTAFKVQLKDKNGVQIWEADPVYVSRNATTVTYNQGASNAVDRTQEDKNQEIISIFDFIGDDVDGTGATDYTTGITNAVAEAVARSADLYWPHGVGGSTYLTTATIPSLHTVRHVGPGIIKRGSDLFTVELQDADTNNLYVATTGLDTNDGLSSSEPMLTVQKGLDQLKNYGPLLEGTWKINLAAGTYVEEASLSGLQSKNRIQVLGPAVADGTTPTAIMQSTGGAAKTGLRFSSQMRVQVEDVKLIDYNDTGTPGASGNGSAITASEFCDLFTRNVFASNCDSGIECAEQSRLRVQAGIVSANATGIRIIGNVTFTVGTGGSAADITGATGPAILNNTVTGVLAQEASLGHLDFCYIDGNGVGCEVVEKSRFHILGSQVSNNTTGVRARINSSFFDSPTTVNTFSSNTDDFSILSGSFEVDNDQNARNAAIHVLRETATITTQSATPVSAATYTIPASMISSRGAGFKVHVYGTVLGTADTKTYDIKLGTTTIATHTIAAGTAAWSIEVELTTRTGTGSPSQKVVEKTWERGGTINVDVTTTTAEDLAVAKVIDVLHSVTNVADTSRIQGIDIEIIR